MPSAPETSFADSARTQLPLWDEGAAAAPVRLRHSLRARRLAVRIAATGQVELVVPRGVTERRALDFLHSQSAWVQRHVARRRALLPAPEAFPPRVLRIPLLGETWHLYQSGGTGRPRLHASTPGVLELRGQGTPAHWRRCLLNWLKHRALAELGTRLQAEATAHGFGFSAVRIRLQRTRWGSCSTRGVISLNLALLFQPADVVRYLLCHELAHTRHMNHSPRFWACVAQCEPRWRELDRALLQGWRHVPAWITETT